MVVRLEFLVRFYCLTFAKLKKRLQTKKYNQKHATYLWTREKNDSSNPHYQCVLFLDYNKTFVLTITNRYC
ncbi:inovirus Gp2 family protein [Vibrio vulnificus]|nr:inovirus Gp2 family protein [Vibrio vulnificus]